MERRYLSPYRHWVSGFAFEVLLIVAFIAFLCGAAILISRLVG